MFQALKTRTPQAAATEPPRRRGRPLKRSVKERIYGMTLRIPSDLRRALRRRAEDETDVRGGDVVSMHDVIIEALTEHLARKTRRRHII